MYSSKISERLQGILKKLSKRDKNTYNHVIQKMDEIVHSSDVDHYKNLRYNLKDSKRVHIGPFVLVFQFNPATNEIYFDDFDHHDNIYEK